MSLDWPQELPDWVVPPPDIALRNWRERVARVCEEECAYFARLPYVRGLAVIGSVGRGDPWPLSDIDMLVVAERVEGEHPNAAVRREEQKRNDRLHAAGIPNDVEASIWTVTPEEIEPALSGDVLVFLGKVGDLPWSWQAFLTKAHGGQAVVDAAGQLGRFIERCGHVLFSSRLLGITRRQTIDDMEARQAEVCELMAGGHWSAASLGLMRMAHEISTFLLLCWGRVPQSISRSASRFLSAAKRAQRTDVARWLLDAVRLRPEQTMERFIGLPRAATVERNRLLAIRVGSGEDVDELAVTRDLLHVRFWVDVCRSSQLGGPFPKWTGVAEAPEDVGAQYQAVNCLLQALQNVLTAWLSRKPSSACAATRSGITPRA